MSTTPSPTQITCHNFNCFWHHCSPWIITWMSTGILDFICGCWALYELIHIYSSIRRINSIKSSSNPADIFRGRTNTNSDNYLASFNGHKNATPPSSFHDKSCMNSPIISPPSHPSKMQLFESRKSQKLFLFIIFLEGMFRTFEFIDVPFSFTHCNMTRVDEPNLGYAIIAEIAPKLFCYAFSCLGYEMSKIYFTLTKPRPHESKSRKQSIKCSLYFVIIFTILITIQSILANIFFILYFQNKAKYKHISNIIEAIDFYSYGGFCIVLGIYFIRFAIPIYSIYQQILRKLTYQERKEDAVIETSISSDRNQPEQIIQQQHQIVYKNTKHNGTKKAKHIKYKYWKTKHGIESQTHALNYFVSSMKRTWLMALYCGIAFILRAFVLLLFSNDLESKFWVLAPYQFIFEIVPNLMMLYIYHYSTKNMTQRYQHNLINT